MKRVLTSLLLVPPVLYVILVGPQELFLAVVAVLATLCYREYQRIVATQGMPAPAPLGYVAGLGLLFLPLVAPTHDWLLLLVTSLIAITWMLRADDLSRALPAAAALVFGVLYIFGAWRSGVSLRAVSPYWLFFAVSLNWVGDVVAFYVGRRFGTRRLAPRVSPGKSWEGAAGSLVAATVLGGAYVAWQFALPVWQALPLAMVANVAGQVGDLCESAMKRGAGVKDSGRMLPGHGGWLDRLDSSLFSMPATYAVLTLLGRAG